MRSSTFVLLAFLRPNTHGNSVLFNMTGDILIVSHFIGYLYEIEAIFMIKYEYYFIFYIIINDTVVSLL